MEQRQHQRTVERSSAPRQKYMHQDDLEQVCDFFGWGSGEALKDLTQDLTRRIEHEETEHPPGKEGVQAILQRRHAARSKASRDMTMRKAMVTIGAKPEERQPLACILLGSLSDVHEFTVAMVDTGCTAYQVATQEVMRYLQKNIPDALSLLRSMMNPLRSTHARHREVPESPIKWGSGFGTSRTRGAPPKEMIYETDAIEGGSTGDCTLLQGGHPV